MDYHTCHWMVASRLPAKLSRFGKTARPGFENKRNEPESAKDYWVKNIHNPSLQVFAPPAGKANGTAVVVCPGGGFRLLVYHAEGVEPAEYLVKLGITVFVLKYRLPREEAFAYSLDKHSARGCAACDASVRSRAKEYGVDPARVGMLGFSAGGEVVASVPTFPAKAILRRKTRLTASMVNPIFRC